MYHLNKIIGWVLSPLGLLFLGLGFAWALRLLSRLFRSYDQKVEVDETGHFNARPVGMTKGERRCLTASRWVIGLTVGFMWIMSCGVTTRLVGVGLEKRWSQDGVMHGSIEGLPSADAIVVLGGGMGAHKKCHAPEMFGSADRVWQGARLYKAGLSSRVFCTGGGCEDATVPLLVDFGVPREAIRFSEEPRNTEEEAKLIKARLVEVQCPSGTGEDEISNASVQLQLSTSTTKKPKILLVTSAWHMNRALSLFEHAGFEVIPAPTDFEMSYILERGFEVSDLFPSVEALARNTYAVKEWVARFGYWVLGK